MAHSDATKIRNISLIEVLTEEIHAKGVAFEEPDDLPNRTEEQILAFFRELQLRSESTNDIGIEPDLQTFKKWFPGLQNSGTATLDARLRVLCFHNAGSAEDMYTSEGTGNRRTPSPLLEWCRANKAECLAVQLPGRNMRRSERPLGSCQEVAEALFPVVASRLSATPYMVVAHSVGTWIAFEFLQLARSRSLRMPQRVFFSAMAAPDIGGESRPWRQQHLLSEAEFKVECREWDVNEVVFSPGMWGTYQPLMRADFCLFDQYQFDHQGKPLFQFPMTVFWGASDKKVTREMVEGWQRVTSGEFQAHCIQGHHLWPLQPACKTVWLQQIVAEFPL